MLIRNVYADMIFNDNSMGELKGLIYLNNNSTPSLPRAVMVTFINTDLDWLNFEGPASSFTVSQWQCISLKGIITENNSWFEPLKKVISLA